MMHTTEEKALIEAVRSVADTGVIMTPPIGKALLAYEESLTTPPSVLPPAPEGKRWVRVEYPDGWGDAKDGDCIVNAPDPGFFVFSGGGSEYCRGLAQALRHGWRLVDDPEADSLEKIADEIELHLSCHVPREWAGRIRALIGEGQK